MDDVCGWVVTALFSGALHCLQLQEGVDEVFVLDAEVAEGLTFLVVGERGIVGDVAEVVEEVGLAVLAGFGVGEVEVAGGEDAAAAQNEEGRAEEGELDCSQSS